MNSIKIATRTKTNLTLRLEQLYDISYYTKPTFLKQLLSTKIEYPEIYFHKGILNADALKLIENSKLVFVNSSRVQKEIFQKLNDISRDKIQVVLPYYHTKKEYDKEIKKEFKHKHNIDTKSKILLITAKDLQKSGLSVVFDMISRMYQENFTLIIESNSKQIAPLRLQLDRSNPTFQYRLLENHEQKEELFIASDIFLLPTTQKYFSIDVLRAMYYRNAVFVMENNDASEIIDVFSLIQSSEDRSISFKVDSLLINKEELKKIQKENQKVAQQYTLERSLEKTVQIIEEFLTFN